MYTLTQAAKEIGVTRQTIWLWIKLDNIKAEMYGNNYLIEEAEVKRIIKERA